MSKANDGICRTCLGSRTASGDETSRFAKLFAPPSPGRPRIIDMLTQIALVQIMENDGLPSLICFKCIKSTYNAFAFKQLCEESDTKLRNYLDLDRSDIAPMVIKNEQCDKDCKLDEGFLCSSRDAVQDKINFDEMSETDDLVCGTMENHMDDLQPLSAISFNVKDEFGRDACIPDIVNKNIHVDSAIRRDKLKSLLDFKCMNSDVKTELEVNISVSNEQNSSLITLQHKKRSFKSQNEFSNKKSKNKKNLSLNSDSVKSDLETIHSCAECGDDFPSYKELKQHMKLHHEKKNAHVTCKICNQTFAYKQTLTRHMKIHQENTKNKLCTFCGKSFLRADDLKRHTRIHTGERPYSCDQCPKKYKQSSELKDHMKSHSTAKCYMCTECGKSLATRNGLYIHMKVHRGEKNRECKICGNKFVTNGELNSHINHIHSREKPFECLYDGCSRAFTTKLSLKTHLRAHTGEKPYQCTICGKALATSSSLHEHKRIHTGEKPKKCNICERRLGNSQALKKHMRLHTGERPYQCSICFEKFICASTLSTHIKIKHMEKQHRCSICHKMFALGTKLRQHMRLHLDKKNYKCDLCNMTFNQKSKLFQHIKVHENDKEIDVNICREETKQISLNSTPITQLNMSNMILSQYM